MSNLIIKRLGAKALLLTLLLTVAAAAVFGCAGEAATSATADAAAATATSAPAGEWVTVDVQQAHEQLGANEAAQIVDVREPDEWATTGVPPGAVLIPLGQLEQRAPAELAKDKPVYVICNSGNRSQTASDILVKLGYTEVYNVGGGIQAWLKAGLPVDTYTP